MSRNINRKITSSVHRVAKFLAVGKNCGVGELVELAVALYKKDYPEGAVLAAPTQNPLLYPTADTSISLCEETREYIKTLPVSGSAGGTKSALDRIVIHYQNSIDCDCVPKYLRKNWLNPEHTKWAESIPEE